MALPICGVAPLDFRVLDRRVRDLVVWHALVLAIERLAADRVDTELGCVRDRRNRHRSHSAKTNGQHAPNWMDAIVNLTPIVFLIGLGCAMSLGVDTLIGPNLSQAESSRIEQMTKPISQPEKLALRPRT